MRSCVSAHPGRIVNEGQAINVECFPLPSLIRNKLKGMIWWFKRHSTFQPEENKYKYWTI